MKPGDARSSVGEEPKSAAQAQHKNYGKVPSYLNKYKDEREA